MKTLIKELSSQDILCVSGGGAQQIRPYTQGGTGTTSAPTPQVAAAQGATTQGATTQGAAAPDTIPTLSGISCIDTMIALLNLPTVRQRNDLIVSTIVEKIGALSGKHCSCSDIT